MMDLTRASTEWAARVRHTAARRLFLDRHAEFWLGQLRATWSLGQLRARVVDVADETGDVKTFRLRPNRHWTGHRAGQHTAIAAEIDGVRVRRWYSLSSAPGDRLLAVTVKRVPGGRVSGWLHDHVRPGHVLGLEPAAGGFVLPEPAPEGLLMLSGGSGITPVMSMVRALAAAGAVRELTFVHHARSRDDVIFGAELEALARRHPGLRLVLCPGRFDEEGLARLVPDFAARRTFLCGPPGLMARALAMWRVAGAADRLHVERFTAAGAATAGAQGAEVRAVEVRLARSGRTIAASTAGALLDELERAGQRPPHGCRMGICHTCRARKRSGVVRNLLTGAVSSEADEDIQICISAPCSDLELSL
ncbi:MAG TPA: ferredoxin reductase [Kofleriaceae bacterium]|nr:ferredoxin reductase [Kofleriaceae bacterium]